jgi:Icc-related predicted phosphoesterase
MMVCIGREIRGPYSQTMSNLHPAGADARGMEARLAASILSTNPLAKRGSIAQLKPHRCFRCIREAVVSHTAGCGIANQQRQSPVNIAKKVMTVSDLHQRIALYGQLEEAVRQHQPDILCCVGDILEANEPLSEGCLSEEDVAILLSGLSCDVVIVRGNHELSGWTRFEEAWNASSKPLYALHGTAVAFGPLMIVGFPCWMGDDESYANGRELPKYSYEEWRPLLLKETGPPGRALWLMHEPPDTSLAEIWAYEPQWGQAVREYQPLLVVSGHDHATPFSLGNWHVTIGNSTCINAGQRVYPTPGKLVYCLLSFEFPTNTPCLPKTFEFTRFE